MGIRKHQSANGSIDRKFNLHFVLLIHHECAWNNDAFSGNENAVQYQLKVFTIDTEGGKFASS